jgi:hypothetical protein
VLDLIVNRTWQDECFESGFITLVEPAIRLVFIAKSDVGQSDIGVDRGVRLRRSESLGAKTSLRKTFLKQGYHDAIARYWSARTGSR